MVNLMDLNVKELVADIKAMVAQWHYNKNETYTQAEILALIRDAVANLKLVDVVQELPTTNIKNNQLYLVVNEKNILNNKFDIFLYVDNDWEQIDKLEFEIANYYNKNEVDALLATKSNVGHRHDNSTNVVDGFMSSSDKAKLDGIESEANKTVVDSSLSSSSTNPVQNKVVKSALDNKAGLSTATSSANGLLSSSDKAKLDGIATGANKTIVDDSLSGSSTNPVQNKVVKSALDNKAGLSTATSSANGLLSSSDKAKLDGIEAQANKITVDSALSTTSTNPVQNKEVKNALDNKVDKIQGKGLSTEDYSTTEKTKLSGIENEANKITVDSALSTTSTNPVQNNIINNALNNKVDKVSGKGLSTNDFTTDEKNKLAGIAAGANKTIVDSSLSSSSTNPVQNKVINTALNGKSSTNHTHTVDSSLSDSSTNPVQNKVVKSALDDLKTELETEIVDVSTNGTLELQAYAKTSDLANVATSGSYNDLTNKPTIPSANSTASNIKMDGTQSAGSLSTFAKADHVHPTDTSRAASDHSHGNINNSGVIANQASKNVVTDANGKITTEAKPTIPSANSTASNIKMDGTQSAGSLSTFAKADHVHPTDTSRASTNVATTSANGLMSSTDKTKLDSIANSANNYSHPTYNNVEKTTSGLYKIKTNNLGHIIEITEVVKADITALGIPASDTNTTYGVVSQSANGLMSSSDKTKLDKSMSISAANIAGTTSAYTATLTGVTLTHGTLIALYNAIGANAANATLNVNSLGAKPIYYNASAIPAGRFPNKSTCLFMYNTSLVSTGCWQLIYSYDSNNTYTAATESPVVDGTATPGVSAKYAREDHVHPTDTSRAASNHTHGNITNAGAIGSTANLPIITTTSGKLTTGSFEGTATNIKMNGTQSVGSLNTFARGDHVHPVDTSRAASSHTHGNITNAGAIGSAANLPIITGTNGVLQASSFGTAANTFCQGNDSRLSNSRVPVFTDIPASSSATKDLNNYTTGGFYYCDNDAESPYVSNQPRTSNQKAFFLLVETWGATNANYVKQTLTYYDNSTTYVRTKAGSSTGWKAWIEVTKDTNTTYTAESTATNIKMNGTQATGSLSTYARGDHVHPVDTSRAAASHNHNTWQSTAIANGTLYYNEQLQLCDFYYQYTTGASYTAGAQYAFSSSVVIPSGKRPVKVIGAPSTGSKGVILEINTDGTMQVQFHEAISKSYILNFHAMWHY